MDATELARAGELYRAGQFSEADAIYQTIQGHDPGNRAVLTRLGEIALLNNQTETAAEYLKAALKRGSWLARRWPLSTQLYISLAMTCYRADRFEEAADWFNRAAGPVVLPPFRDLQALGSHMALFDGQKPYALDGAANAKIPFTQTDLLPVVQVSVNGSEPLPFFIDTGGAEVIVDTEVARRVGAVQAGTINGQGGGTQGATGLGKVDSLTLGDLTIQNLPIHIMDTGHFATVFDGLAVKGAIGTRLLLHFLTTIDYINGCLILRPKTTPIEITSARVIPFWLAQTHYMLAQGSINGKTPTLMFIDTGLAGKGFSADERTLEEAGISVDWEKAGTGTAAFGETRAADITAGQVTLGSGENRVTARDVQGVAFQKPFGILGSTLGFRVGGVVSHTFFRPYALTLDFAGMRLILEG